MSVDWQNAVHAFPSRLSAVENFFLTQWYATKTCSHKCENYFRRCNIFLSPWRSRPFLAPTQPRGFFSGSKRSERDVGRSTSCVPLSRNSISCVLKCPLHVYQLSTPNMTSCMSRLVRSCFRCIERYRHTKCPTIGRLLHSFVVLYTQLYSNKEYCWMI
jgi:hypothetical protein